MNLRAYPVFRKDLFTLGRFLLGALAIEVLVIVFILVPYASGGIGNFMAVIRITVAFVAAAQIFAEEKSGKHHLFLERLTASRKRVAMEKLTAAGVVILGAFLIPIILIVIDAIRNMEFNPDYVGYFINLLALTIAAFLIGLPLSYLLTSAMAVVLVGLGIFSGIGAGYVSLRYLGVHFSIVAGTILILAAGIACLFLILTSRLVNKKLNGKSALQAQIRYYLQENRIIHLTCVLLAFLTVAITPIARELDSIHPILAIPILTGLFGLIVLGISTFSREEKTGLDSVLHHHPIFLSRVYWVRFLMGLIPAWMLAAALANLSVEFLREDFLNREFGHQLWIPYVQFFFWTMLAYVSGIVGGNFFSGTISSVLGGLIVLSLVAGLEAFRVYSALAMGLFMINASVWDPKYPNLPFYPDWQPFALFAGLLLVGWKAATDRKIITGSSGYRFVRLARMTLFLLALIFLLTRTGLRDFFYLIANLDIGPS